MTASSMQGRLSSRQRPSFLQRLGTEPFDVLVIGGGINGAGILRDLSLRSRNGSPLRLALVEKDHFAYAASSKNSHLVHGGLRYLKYLDFGLVREALHERAILLRMAPHAVWPLPFLLPIYGRRERAYYQSGLFLYDFLAGASNIKRHDWLNRDEAQRLEPALSAEDLRGALRFYDAGMRASRLVHDLLRESVERGCLAVNRAEFVRLEQNDTGELQAHILDRCSGEQFSMRARVVIHTQGAWEKSSRIKLVRGSHLVLPGLLSHRHALAFFEKQGRILFVLPYGPCLQFTLVGTTEWEQEQPEPVAMHPEEEQYLREQLAPVIPALRDRKTLSSFSALRPLVYENPASSVSGISRTHRIWKTAPGVYHVGGGKFTTFRAVCEEAADQVVREHFPHTGKCRTGDTAVDQNSPATLREFHTHAGDLARRYEIPAGTVEYLIETYGRRAGELLDLCREPELRRPIVAFRQGRRPPYIQAQIPWAIENDMVSRWDDFARLSTDIGYISTPAPAEIETLCRRFGLDA